MISWIKVKHIGEYLVDMTMCMNMNKLKIAKRVLEHFIRNKYLIFILLLILLALTQPAFAGSGDGDPYPSPNPLPP